MNIIEINATAEGYYSGNTYEENIYISKDFYETIKDDVENLSFYIDELDGKHSGCEVTICIFEYTEEQLLNMEICDHGNDRLYDYILEFENIDEEMFEADIKKVGDYLDSLDAITNLTVKVKKSNIEKVLKFCENL